MTATKNYLPMLLALLLVFGCKKPAQKETEIERDDIAMPFTAWVYEGDSITDVSTAGLPGNYPNQLTQIDKYIANTPQVNKAATGDQISLMLNEYASEIHPYRPKDSTQVVAFAIMAGTNDAGFSNRTSRQIYNDLKTEWAYARADGFKVIAFCIVRSTIIQRDTAAVNVNKLIVADKSKYDYLIRTDLILPNPADLQYFYPDGLHPIDAGSLLIAREVINVCKK